ncbi:MAG: DUF975 family protein [Lachnospiraceae bacterium]|nr:DUF975 family protein [Lachnospiraceae bacterium]
MNHRSTVELKAIARDKLLGNYSTVIGAIVTVQLIFVATNYIAKSVSDLYSVVGMAIYVAVTLISGLIGAVFTVGELTMYLKLACGDKIAYKDIFSAFFGHPDKIIVLDFIFSLRCLIWLLPAGLTYAVMYYKHLDGETLTFLLVGLSVLGIVGMIYTYIRLSQVFFIFLDYPDLTVREIMEKSIDLMHGQYGRFLGIMVSFIPIYLLGILSLGIGFIFIQPYRNMTYTEFYLGIAAGKPVTGNNFDVMIG